MNMNLPAGFWSVSRPAHRNFSCSTAVQRRIRQAVFYLNKSATRTHAMPSSNTQTEVANNGIDKPQEAKHNRYPVSLSKPMTMLISVDHAEANFTTATKTDTEFAQNSAQWGIPLAQHRTVTCTILRGVYFKGTIWSRASVDGSSVKCKPPEILAKGNDKQEPAIDTKQQPMSVAPPGALGLAIASCVLVFSYIRRKHPTQQTATLPPR